MTRAEPALAADAFLAWAMEQPRGRFALVHGQVVAMARALTVTHHRRGADAAIARRIAQDGALDSIRPGSRPRSPGSSRL